VAARGRSPKVSVSRNGEVLYLSGLIDRQFSLNCAQLNWPCSRIELGYAVLSLIGLSTVMEIRQVFKCYHSDGVCIYTI